MLKTLTNMADITIFPATIDAATGEIIRAAELDLTAYGFNLNGSGLVPLREVSIKEWDACGKVLKAEFTEVSRRATKLQFAIGDWLLYGENHYGDEIWNYLDTGDYEYETVQNFKYVARNVPQSLRNDALSYQHHVAVAPLESREKQKEWLEKAEKGNMSARAMGEQVRAERGIAPKSEVQCPNCGSRFTP